MGINITAIFPIDSFNASHLEVIKQLEQQQFKIVEEYYQAVLKDGFIDFRKGNVKWFYDDKKIDTRPPSIPDINVALELPEGLVFRFRNNCFEIYSVIRAFQFLKYYPNTQLELLALYKEIGTALGAKNCWIMGDHEPLYHRFIRDKEFHFNDQDIVRKQNLGDLYIEHEDTYDINGYYNYEF